MIVRLIDWLSSAAGLTDTFAEFAHNVPARSIAAALIVAVLSWACGSAAIRWLARRFREPLKSGSAQLDRLHEAKALTPTMGGIFLLAGVIVATLLFADPSNRFVILALASAIGLALVGGIDDLIKLRSHTSGLGWKWKLAGQACVAALPAICLYCGWCGAAHGHFLPLPGGAQIELGWMTVPWIVLVIIATSNAVNVTDGLDGLAAGSLLPTTVALSAIAYLCVDGDARELVVVAAAMIGGLFGFLCYNRHPAHVFMGNVGSLSLGGLLAVLAIGTSLELLLPIVAGVFVAEAASVILQVGWYRRTGRRVLRCAPLHHHFEFVGWPERKIVAGFWVASTACALAGIMLAIAALTPGAVPHRQTPPLAAAHRTSFR